MGTWKTIKNADGKRGVRYREHATRKHGAIPDRYYTLSYWWQGRTVNEAVGWASDKWSPSKCFEILATLKRNQATGKRPCTLKEMREIEDRRKKAAAKKAKADEKNQISFGTFFDEIYLPEAKTRWKPETVRKADEHAKNWIKPVLEDIPLREIKLSDVNRIKAKLTKAQRSPRTQQYVFRTFSMVWNSAFDHGIVTGPSPTKANSFRLPKVDNERQRYLTVDEEKKLLAEVLKINKQAHDMAIVSLDSGLRFGEVAKLTWGCIDTEGGTLNALDTKTSKDRIVPMTIRLRDLFQSMPTGKGNDLVFPNTQGNIHSQVPSSFKRGLKNAKLNAGVENPKLRASYHSLRHTYASRLVQAGVDLYRVQRLLGHSTPVMTARYSKLADDDLKEAVSTMERKTEIKRKKGAKVIPLRRNA